MAWVFPSSSDHPLLFKRMPVLAEYHVIDFRQIYIGLEAKSPWRVVENKRQLFCQSVANLDPELFCACRGERSRGYVHSQTRKHWGREWVGGVNVVVLLPLWILSAYFESLLLPQLLRGENDSKQSDEFQATLWEIDYYFGRNVYWYVLSRG